MYLNIGYIVDVIVAPDVEIVTLHLSFHINQQDTENVTMKFSLILKHSF